VLVSRRRGRFGLRGSFLLGGGLLVTLLLGRGLLSRLGGVGGLGGVGSGGRGGGRLVHGLGGRSGGEGGGGSGQGEGEQRRSQGLGSHFKRISLLGALMDLSARCAGWTLSPGTFRQHEGR